MEDLEILGDLKMNNGYISMLRSPSMGSGHIVLFSSSHGGETAGSIACSSTGSSYSSTSYSSGETAGSVACSSGGSSSCGGGSFSAVV